jgi:hypothetical protein
MYIDCSQQMLHFCGGELALATAWGQLVYVSSGLGDG